MRSKRRKHPVTALKLTSMMDILVVLLLFLLKSFVVDAELVTPASGIELPKSSSQDSPQSSLVVVIQGNQVLVEGEAVAVIDHEGRQTVPGVMHAVREAQRRLQAIHDKGGQRELKVTLQGDKATPYYVIDSVMYTIQQEGCGDIALAVLQKGRQAS